MNFVDFDYDNILSEIEPFSIDFSQNTLAPSSSGSSFSLDFTNSNSFEINYQQYSTPNIITSNDNSLDLATSNQILSSKQDVSCGTESIDQINDTNSQKPAVEIKISNISLSNTSLSMSPNNLPTFVSSTTTFPLESSASILNLMQKKSHESFKLIEKIQPKKSRTKYDKTQLNYLEEVFKLNQYPEIMQVESLCKTLGISKEKINIWFQNRRARNKKNVSKTKINSSMNTCLSNLKMDASN